MPTPVMPPPTLTRRQMPMRSPSRPRSRTLSTSSPRRSLAWWPLVVLALATWSPAAWRWPPPYVYLNSCTIYVMTNTSICRRLEALTFSSTPTLSLARPTISMLTLTSTFPSSTLLENGLPSPETPASAQIAALLLSTTAQPSRLGLVTLATAFTTDLRMIPVSVLSVSRPSLQHIRLSQRTCWAALPTLLPALSPASLPRPTPWGRFRREMCARGALRESNGLDNTNLACTIGFYINGDTNSWQR